MLNCVNSFAQRLACLFYLEYRRALLAYDGVHHLRGRVCERVSNLVCLLVGASSGLLGVDLVAK